MFFGVKQVAWATATMVMAMVVGRIGLPRLPDWKDLASNPSTLQVPEVALKWNIYGHFYALYHYMRGFEQVSAGS